MTNKEIVERTEALATEVIAQVDSDISLVDVEYVKEGSTWYLRVFIDKPGGVTIDDCVAVTHPMNERLDAKPYINDAYIFEVSSPGLDRPLKKDKDFERNIENKIEIKLFSPKNGQKEFCGILKEYSGDSILVDVDGQMMSFERKALALVRLAIDF